LKERRKHPRYPAKENTAIVTEPWFMLTDTLIDVSKGGLALSYKALAPLMVGSWVLINIIRGDIGFLETTVKITSDVLLSNNSYLTRRCGVEFGKITSDQMGKVNFMIDKFRVGI